MPADNNHSRLKLPQVPLEWFHENTVSAMERRQHGLTLDPQQQAASAKKKQQVDQTCCRNRFEIRPEIQIRRQ